MLEHKSKDRIVGSNKVMRLLCGHLYSALNNEAICQFAARKKLDYIDVSRGSDAQPILATPNVLNLFVKLTQFLDRKQLSNDLFPWFVRTIFILLPRLEIDERTRRAAIGSK